MEAWPVIITTGMFGSCSLIRSSSSIPSISGILMSQITMSGAPLRTVSSASNALSVVLTW